jgi:two-component system, NtrC family, nitrogen regulation response regulator GlnG
MSAVWVVDDDESIRWVLERALSRAGYQVRAFAGAAQCLAALETDAPAALVSDIRMPGENGIDLLKKIKASHARLPVIIMTAFSDLDSAVSALQGGAFEYLPKPFDIDTAVALIARAVKQGEPSDPVEEVATGQREILGKAASMQEVFRAIGRLSNSNVTVLITGESGTGKELVARALHDHSPRAGKVFVALNTAAIPRDLLESELFGHERGAFTGAQATRVGRFEQAEGGTLFLDEIGDMPAELQTRLLRVLSDGQYYRVGGHQPQRANVRVIAATHQDLEERVRQGLFREDLFHRLNVIRLRLPALRDRSEDTALLTKHFLQASARELGGDVKRLTEEAMQVMTQFRWPGNVRQLENVCHWLTVMAPSQTIDVGDLPPEVRGAPVRASSLAASVAQAVGTPLIPVDPALGAGYGEPMNMSARADFEPEADRVHSSAQMVGSPSSGGLSAWSNLLEREVSAQLDQVQRGEAGGSDLMDRLTREFESVIIRTALRHTRGRRIDAAQRLGIGRNTITRKIADLHLESDER